MRSRIIVAVAACGVVLTGCSGHSPSSTGQLNETTARDKIQKYLTETLNALPPGVALTLPPREPNGQKPEFDVANLGPAPCDGDPNDTTGPKKAQVWYFLTGVPAGKVGDYFTAVVHIWRDRLWQVWPMKDTQSNTVTHDGYLLAVARFKNSDPNREDGLALAGTSPCFPNSATGTATPLPSSIEHR
ncbi:hypothetical protein [Nocardia terpenica]|uniref:hypothetical protein n=1 Tax=Nocardia terpenica TaxID=455432 RepID=UPI0002D32B93|nr:hypothetical protein [Nocardia terpenica]NQE87452.1 hypothetical protein [Nocardia terpenica]